MAHRYPADVRLQWFYTENYDKENGARLESFLHRKKGGDPSDLEKGYKYLGLPTINPMQFARNMKIQEEENLKRIIEEARSKQEMEEMRAVHRRELKPLYDGFTKEEKGRHQYLKARHQKIPESKFTYPVQANMEYGWKIGEAVTLKRPKFARSRIVNDRFYTRNDVPDLANPTHLTGVAARSTKFFA